MSEGFTLRKAVAAGGRHTHEQYDRVRDVWQCQPGGDTAAIASNWGVKLAQTAAGIGRRPDGWVVGGGDDKDMWSLATSPRAPPVCQRAPPCRTHSHNTTTPINTHLCQDLLSFISQV